MENYNNNFKNESFYIGIDVHKLSWNVTILNNEFKLGNFSQDPNPAVLIQYLQKNYPGGTFSLVYEAGFCGFEPYRYFIEHGMKAIVVSPLDVPTSGKESTQKTDKIDSNKLAKALRAQMLRGIDIPSRELEADCDLIKQRQKFSKRLRAVKIMVKSLLMKLSIVIPEDISESASRSWNAKYVDWLKNLTHRQPSHELIFDNYIREVEHLTAMLKQIKRQLKEIEKKPAYSEDMEILQSIPGIGFITAMNLRLHLGDINRFPTFDMLCSYVGLTPSTHSSGEKIRVGPLTKRGRSQLREYLIEASWIAIKVDPALLLKYKRLTGSMVKNKAIIRIAKSLLNRARFLLKNRVLYELNIYPDK